MSLSRRLRNIALSQIKAIKERLDRLDADAALGDADTLAGAELAREIYPTPEPPRRLSTPEEIAPATKPAEAPRPPQVQNPLAIHYRILGVPEGSDLDAVEAAYKRLIARCDPQRFPQGSDERATAEQIRKRVEHSYDALKDVLDPTAGRFDKLEL
ncbi:MAG: hypothetical protein ACP5VE_11320 [Chthonomonadales bacterium]